MDKGKIEVKQMLAYDDALGYLEDLVASFREGRIVVRKGEEFVTLTPLETVEIEVSAKHKKDKQKFSLELSWAALAEDDEPLSISDKLPEIKEEILEGCEKVEAAVEGAQDTGNAAGAAGKSAPEKTPAPTEDAAKKGPAKPTAKAGSAK
ncbi:MAG: amphi-Trp domain-containing protein [Desulfovibrio sp.]